MRGHSSVDATVGRVVVKIGRADGGSVLVLLPLLLVLLLTLSLEVELVLLLLLLARTGEIRHGVLPVLPIVSPTTSLAESPVHEGDKEDREREEREKEKEK